MFIDWGGRPISLYWGNVLRCGKSGRGKSGFFCILQTSISERRCKKINYSHVLWFNGSIDCFMNFF